MLIGEPLKMDEYIRREDVIEWFMPYAHVGESIDADVVISDIKGMKAADVAPVRHGRWLEVREKRLFGEHYFLCSNCKSRNGLMIPFNYCPNCGCKMDG